MCAEESFYRLGRERMTRELRFPTFLAIWTPALCLIKCSAEYRKGECRLFVAVQIHLALENVYKLHNLYN